MLRCSLASGRGRVRSPLSNDRTKRTVCSWPCNIYVSSHVTHVPAPGSACVSQDCASGRSGQSLDGSRAEHLSIPIPENAEHCPTQWLVRWEVRAGERRADGASPVTVLRPALHSIVVAPHTRRHGGLQAHPCRGNTDRSCRSAHLVRVAGTTHVRPRHR
jgi:hypothetical protein